MENVLIRYPNRKLYFKSKTSKLGGQYLNLDQAIPLILKEKIKVYDRTSNGDYTFQILRSWICQAENMKELEERVRTSRGYVGISPDEVITLIAGQMNLPVLSPALPVKEKKQVKVVKEESVEAIKEEPVKPTKKGLFDLLD